MNYTETYKASRFSFYNNKETLDYVFGYILYIYTAKQNFNVKLVRALYITIYTRIYYTSVHLPHKKKKNLAKKEKKMKNRNMEN